jgi:hypothetical protein
MKRNNLKIEAYEPCPCGSNSKFKFCCYEKAKEPISYISKAEYPDGRIDNMIKQNWNASELKQCYGFNQEECSEEVIKAHSIQDNRILNRICEDNHVLHIKQIIQNRESKAEFQRISHLKASTFFGFCNFHDTKIFEPIEKTEYVGEHVQNFLLAFRALVMGYHNKRRTLKNIQNIFKNKPSLMKKKQMVDLYRVTFLEVEDYEEIYNGFKHNYLKDDFKGLKTIYRQLNFEIKFATCSAFAIYKDLKGKEIVNKYRVRDEKVALVYLNVYPIQGKTNVIFSYQVSDESLYGEYFNQIENLTNKEYMEYLNYLIIEMTENIFFNPSMISSLSDKEKSSILESFQTLFKPTKIGYLKEKENYFNFDLFCRPK